MNDLNDIVEILIKVKDSCYRTNANDVVTKCDSVLRKIVVALEKELDEE